jgi:hypothetical protein
MKKIRYIIAGEDNSIKFARHLIWSSRSFHLDPLPDNHYSFDVKNEDITNLTAFLDDWGVKYTKEEVPAAGFMRMRMRMGKVTIGHSYAVDLDNQAMVDEAKDCLVEDMSNAAKFDEMHANVHVEEDPDACPGDIPEFLQNQEDDDDYLEVVDADPDNDEFKCEGCGKVLDIEDSIRDPETKELFCPECAKKSTCENCGKPAEYHSDLVLCPKCLKESGQENKD